MDEHDLQTLGREPLGHGGQARPVDEVLRRGRRLRRRATVVRTVPIVAAVALVATAGVLAVRRDPPPDVTNDPAERELPVRVFPCDRLDTEPVPAEDLDGLRLVPTRLPDSVEVDALRAVRQPTGTCAAVDPALVLRADGGDGTVEAEITLEGPYGRPYEGEDGVMLEPRQLRGGEAARLSDATVQGSFDGFTWTEPDGASWIITGVGVDEATVRGVAEALELQGAPPEGEPAAALPDEAVPSGFAVTWQAPGLPEVEDPVRLEWLVTTTPETFPPCEVTIATSNLDAPPGRMFSATSDGQAYDEVAVRGVRGFAVVERGTAFLSWPEAPGVVGTLQCTGDLDSAVRMADSLAEVPPTDPRITDR
jgi:hypothetical protein